MLLGFTLPFEAVSAFPSGGICGILELLQLLDGLEYVTMVLGPSL